MRRIANRSMASVFSVAFLLAGGGLWADSSGPVSVDNGKALWAKSCKVCHESSRMLAMLGVKKPDDLKPQMLAKMDPKKIADVVRNGKGKMKPVPKLTDAQIADIDAYLISLSSGANPTQTK